MKSKWRRGNSTMWTERCDRPPVCRWTCWCPTWARSSEVRCVSGTPRSCWRDTSGRASTRLRITGTPTRWGNVWTPYAPLRRSSIQTDMFFFVVVVVVGFRGSSGRVLTEVTASVWSVSSPGCWTDTTSETSACTRASSSAADPEAVRCSAPHSWRIEQHAKHPKSSSFTASNVKLCR